MSRLTPEEAEERECMAEDRAKGKKEDALIESGIVERFLRGGFECATFPGGQLLYKDEHKVVCAHILYLQQQTDVDKDFITQYQRQVKDLTKQLKEFVWLEGTEDGQTWGVMMAKKNADLTKQLAEKEEEVGRWQQQSNMHYMQLCEVDKTNADLTEQLAEKDRLLADPTLGRLVPIDVQAALDAAIQDSEDVDANT